MTQPALALTDSVRKILAHRCYESFKVESESLLCVVNGIGTIKVVQCLSWYCDIHIEHPILKTDYRQGSPKFIILTSREAYRGGAGDDTEDNAMQTIRCDDFGLLVHSHDGAQLVIIIGLRGPR